MKVRTSARHFTWFLPDLKSNLTKKEFSSKEMRQVPHKEKIQMGRINRFIIDELGFIKGIKPNPTVYSV